MRRFEDWPQRLESYLFVCKKRDFEWGSFDCALFVAGAVQAMTGIDFSDKYRGRYKTERGALMAMRRQGFNDVVGVATYCFGAPSASVLKAQRGDVVAFDTDDGTALGVVDLSGSAFLAVMCHGGLARRPLSQAVLTWRI